MSESEQTPVIDLPVALERLAGQDDLLRELAVMFLEDAPQSLADYRRHLATGEVDEARRAVHTLKGLFSTFEAVEATATAERGVAICENNPADAPANAAELAVQLADVEAALRSQLGI